MPHHIHQLRPIWLILTSPADYEGWCRIVTYAECLICHTRATFAGEQNTRTMQSRMVEEGQ